MILFRNNNYSKLIHKISQQIGARIAKKHKQFHNQMIKAKTQTKTKTTFL